VARSTVPAESLPGRVVHRSGARASRRLLAAVAATALVGLAACSGPEPQAPAPVTVTPTIEPSRTAPPEPVVPIVWPLTGVETPEVAARPAVAIKVENTTQARPQSGLEQADLVWETIVEFDVSRFVAVFHSQAPAEIGPIRSVRPTDPLIASPLHGLFVFSGGQAGILALLPGSGMQQISHDAGADGLFRVRTRSAPHNVYGDIQSFWAQADADHSAAPAQQFAFALRAEQASATLVGTPATTLSFRLSSASNPSWTWDAATGTWLRSEGSTPATVASGARLSAVNVVTVVAKHPNSGFAAQNNAAVPTYELVGEGEAMIATGGKTVMGTWRKAAQEAPLQVFGADGAPLLLAPGNTWVELVPAGSGSYAIS